MKHSLKHSFISPIVAVQGSTLKEIAAASLLFGLQCTAAFADNPPKLDEVDPFGRTTGTDFLIGNAAVPIS